MDLILDDVTIVRAGRPVVAGVSARLRPGRITVILGPNGAGKSSLVKAVAALIPAQGRIMLGERNVATLAPSKRGRLVGYLPQDSVVHWNLRVGDAVALGRIPHLSPFAGLGSDDHAAIADALSATDAGVLVDRLLDTLSGGERARVLLARVLAGRPAWLLADEPLASLDPAHQLDILARFVGLAAGGMGIVLVLHDLVQAARLADDVLLMKDGRAVAFGPADDVLTAPALSALYDVEVEMMSVATGRTIPIVSGRLDR